MPELRAQVFWLASKALGKSPSFSSLSFFCKVEIVIASEAQSWPQDKTLLEGEGQVGEEEGCPSSS